MAFWENMPYTNFHGENQDWIIKTMKKLIDEWAAYGDNLQRLYDQFTAEINAEFDAYKDEINTDFETFKAANTAWQHTIEASIQSLHDYVDNYFDNLDVQTEINNKLDQMIATGQWDQVLQQYFSDLSANVEERLDAQDEIVEGLNNDMAVLNGQMEAFLQSHGTVSATLRTEDVLWVGNVYQEAQLDLDGLLDDYDFITIYGTFSDRPGIQTFEVGEVENGVSFKTANVKNDTAISPSGLAEGEIHVKKVPVEEGQTVQHDSVDVSFSYWHWDGDHESDSTEALYSSSLRLRKITGIKWTDISAQKDAELTDLRVNNQGQTFPTAGAAIRAYEDTVDHTMVAWATDIGTLKGEMQIVWADVEGTAGLKVKVPAPPTYDPSVMPTYCLTVELTGNDHDVPVYQWMDWLTWKNHY